MTKPKEEIKMSRDEMLEELQKEEEEKQQAFLTEINEVCQRYGYNLGIDRPEPRIVPIPMQR